MAAEDEHYGSIHTALLHLTSHLAASTDVARTLAGVTAAAVDLVDGVDYADVMLIEDGQFRSVAPSAPLVTELDAVQQRLQQGPCLEAAVGDTMIRCNDLGKDSRWPQFAAAAVAAGVYSILSFQLYTHQNGAGALNLLGRNPREFDHEVEALGAMLATQAAIALIAANKQRQFASALASRDLIGQAKGITMHRYSVDALHAFEMMVKLSQDSNTPVRVIAQQIIDSSEVPNVAI